MKRFVDSNVIVHALLGGERGDLAAAWIVGSRATQHSRAEAFAVLTGAYKVPAAAAKRLLDALAGDRGLVEFVPQTGEDYDAALARAASGDAIRGGRVYDVLHACTAERMRAAEFVTFNARHFEGITSLRVVDPSRDGLPDDRPRGGATPTGRPTRPKS